MSEEMPRNIIESAEEPVRDDAAKEAQWLQNNVPAEPLLLRWHYESAKLQLFERHLRSLPKYNIGPALRSYLRTRLEWICDNKLYAQPVGTVVVSVNPNGDVDAWVEEAAPALELALEDLPAFGGSVWALSEGKLYCNPTSAEMKGACETFAKDLTVTLAKSMGYEFVDAPAPQELLAQAEVFAVDDEHGLIPVCNSGELTSKMGECFAKLWK